MRIVLNKYNYIVGYCEVGDIENSISVDNFENISLDNILNYQYVDGNFILNPIPENTDSSLVVPEYNGFKWVEGADHQTVIDFWKKEMISASEKTKILRDVGLDGSFEFFELQKRIEYCKQNYINSSHELALEMDKVF